MGYIFYVMGKSAAGKDMIYKELVRRFPEYGIRLAERSS